jgi:hypothetical protein
LNGAESGLDDIPDLITASELARTSVPVRRCDAVASVARAQRFGGDMDVRAWSSGMVAGLIHNVPTVKERVHRIVSEAEGLVLGRPEPMLAT